MNGLRLVARGVSRACLGSIVAVALSLGATACGGGSSADGPGGTGSAMTRDIVQIDGSSTVYPITEAVAEEFQKDNPGAKVTVGVSGTGGGFQKFCRGELDFADASRPIGTTEIDACSKSGITFVELPIAYDGITVVINPKNTWAQSITVEELKKLWEPAAEGKVMRWSQVRAGWPDKEIHLFGPGVDSGTFDYFTESIVGKTDASRGDYTSSEDDNMLVQGVSGDELALGFFGFAYYEENKDKLHAVAVDDGNDDNGKGGVMPSADAIRTGQYRPLSRPVFIYVNIKHLEKPAIVKFMDYYVSKAAGLVSEVGYVPLADAEYALVTKRAAARTPGSMFKTHDPQAGKNLATLLQQ
jgi:phosphate transport system substrate-binding protein